MALTSKNFTDIVTFTRASGGTYFDAAGVLQTASTNAPRFDYDPSTLALKGLLIEEQRTNLLLRSGDLSSTWTALRASIGAATTAPDGTTSAQKIVEDTTATNTHIVSQTLSLSLATAYTFSVFVKAAERSAIRLRVTTSTDSFIGDFDIAGNVVSGTSVAGTGTVSGATISAVRNGWYKVTLSGQLAAGTSPQVDFFIRNSTGTTFPSYTGDGASGLYIWGAQLEAGTFATSYIATTTAQATRAADQPLIGTLSPWQNASAGTFVVEAITGSLNANATLFSLTDGTGSNRIALLASSPVSNRVRAGGNTYDAAATGTITAGTAFKAALAFQANDISQVVNGGAASTSATAVLPAVNKLFVGANETGAPAGQLWVRAIKYFPTRLSNATLQSMTT